MGTNGSSPASCCKRSKVDNACLKSERFLNGRVSEPDLLEWSHHLFCSRSILILTDDKCDLHLQEHPIVDKLLHLDCFQSFGHGIHDLVRIGHRFLGTFFFLHFFFNWLEPDNILCLLAFSRICGREVFPT